MLPHVYKTYYGCHKDIENHIRKLLNKYKITNIYTYNGIFIFKKLPGLKQYHWYDIIKVAAYKQYNYKLLDNLPFREDGRLLCNCSIKEIMQILTKTYFYYTDHALYDTFDIARIMSLINLPIEQYSFSKIN